MGRYRADYRSGGKESYQAFVAAHPTITIDYPRWKRIVRELNVTYMNHALDLGETVYLPRGLGPIGVERKPERRTFTGQDGVTHIILPVNWQESKKQGKRVFYYNDHTEGWTYGWRWYPTKTKGFKLPEIWKFKPLQEWSVKLGKLILSGEVDGLIRYKEYKKHK